jgi:hypothetical protein
MKKELDILFPQSRELVIGGQPFQIREFVASEFSDVIALAGILSSGDIGKAISEESERFFRLISSVTGVPVQTLEKMRMTALAKIVAEITEENAGFFVEVLPSLIQRVSKALTSK